jgi:hypothetical protein
MHLTGKTVNNNSTTILSGLAVAGVVATVALAVRATPQVLAGIRIRQDEKGEAAFKEGAEPEAVAEARKLTRLEILEESWKECLPAAITGAATIACIVGANQIGVRRNAALVGAYALADTAFREYKDEVLAQLGKNKELKIQEAVQQRRLDNNPVNDAQVIITGGGDQLCFDTLTGRYFHSDIEEIRRAENEIKRRILTDMYAPHNEFYDLLGLEAVTVGDELGWNIENLIELVFTSHLATDGRPCLAIGYVRLPRVGYGSF